LVILNLITLHSNSCAPWIITSLQLDMDSLISLEYWLSSHLNACLKVLRHILYLAILGDICLSLKLSLQNINF
jgi:hypothetical protein